MTEPEGYEPTPADFDLSAWVRGVQRNVKTVRVYARPDLEDEVTLLRDRLATMRDDGGERGLGDESPASLRAQIDELTRELEASAVNFKVEGRSSSYREKLTAQLLEQGIHENSGDFVLHLVADQIVQPVGLTFDDLKALADAIEPQVMALIAAAREVNTKAPRVDAPFSPASSAGRTPRRS